MIATVVQYSKRSKLIKDVFSILLGISLATLGIKGFLIPSDFIDGGVTGISMLLSELTHVELPLYILLINTPFVLIGFRQISVTFALKSAVTIMGLALLLLILPIPSITTDKLLSAFFGGVFLGSGIGFSLRGGAALDGTEIMAIILSKRFDLTIGDIILIFNTLLFSAATFLLGIEAAMYSILTYISASKTVDYLVCDLELGVTVMSDQIDALKKKVLSELDLGVTIYKGKGGYSEKEQDILFCVATRFEIPKLKVLIAETDPSAFLIIQKITDSNGGRLQRRHF